MSSANLISATLNNLPGLEDSAGFFSDLISVVIERSGQ